MTQNLPVTAATQVGTCTGTAEGYSKVADLAAVLAPLIGAGAIGSGAVPPTSAPAGGQFPFYINSATAPDTLYWWNPLPAPGAWHLIGTPASALGLLVAADYPAQIANATTGASGAFVGAAIAALNALVNPCAVTDATAPEIAAMTADPSKMSVTVCCDDGTPAPVGIDGAALAAILGIAGGGSSGGIKHAAARGSVNQAGVDTNILITEAGRYLMICDPAAGSAVRIYEIDMLANETLGVYENASASRFSKNGVPFLSVSSGGASLPTMCRPVGPLPAPTIPLALASRRTFKGAATTGLAAAHLQSQMFASSSPDQFPAT